IKMVIGLTIKTLAISYFYIFSDFYVKSIILLFALKMTRPMYQVPKPSNNASKKVIDTPIAKRKKVVLNFVQREEIITKKKNGTAQKNLR
ncbi:hypothetical protein BpHYR1_006209, partial [Brachionus plicatilis]